ncbi:MAG: methyl-accepting chemotaxis protein [Deltaproteobacteria bacterium]|nr:methyl-accepting chemotaxis protein [Deltaproteobacteria bacterium]
MRNASNLQLDGMVKQSRTVVDEYYKIIAANFLDANESFATDATMLTKLHSGDVAALAQWSKAVMRESSADLCTITDDKGIVLVRAHSDAKGDSLANQDTVRAALRGKSASGIVVSQAIPLSIRTCVPIMRNDAIVGTLSLGVSIATESFVDGLKRLSGLEVTLFRGDTRIMSTITDNGKRVIGTKLGNPGIEDAVLKRKQTEFRDLAIFGVPYKTAYWPVIDVENKIIGMWFVGLPIQKYMDERSQALFLGLAAMLCITLCLVGVGVFFGKRLARPIKEVTAFSRAVAEGNLNASLQTRATDEVGTLAASMRRMVENLKDRIAESEQKGREAVEQGRKAQEAMVEANEAKESAEAGHKAILDAAGQIDQVVNRLSAATEQLSAHIEQSGRGTETQRERVSRSATAMAEMNSTVMEVAKNAGIAAEGSDRARAKAAQGADIVQNSVRSINAVQEDTEKLRKNMENLGHQAESISTIMTVISDIADQTNLLALNAAIEAARAGEAGRGFAVVADEVRKLAEKTMAATKEVGNAIGGVQTGTKQSIAAVEQTTGNLNTATGLVQNSGEALAGIVEEVSATAAQVSSIATAAEEQSVASEEISHSLEEINRMADENASAMRQSGEAVADLAQQAQELRTLVCRLTDMNIRAI